MAPKINYRYVYFNVRGRGELVRLIFHASGVQFTDDRVEFSDWPAMKANTPFGTLPYIEIDGQPFGEYLPICRFLARKYNLMGKTDMEQLQTDAVSDMVFQLREAYVRSKINSFLTEQQKKDLGERFIKDQLPKFCDKIEKLLTSSKFGFVVGNNLTMADLAVVDMFDQALIEVPDCLTDKYPKINEHRHKIQAMPKVAIYLAERPDTKL